MRSVLSGASPGKMPRPESRTAAAPSAVRKGMRTQIASKRKALPQREPKPQDGSGEMEAPPKPQEGCATPEPPRKRPKTPPKMTQSPKKIRCNSDGDRASIVENKSPKKSLASKISDEDLRRLLWAVDEGRVKCQECGAKFKQRQGRFGLFFICTAGQACSKIANLKSALELLGDEACPVRIIFELESLDEFRIHAAGARDVSYLQAWMADLGHSDPSPPRLDWSASAPETGYLALGPTESGVRSDASEAVSRIGYVFPLAQLPAIEAALRETSRPCAEAQGFPLRVDTLSEETLAVAERLRARRRGLGRTEAEQLWREALHRSPRLAALRSFQIEGVLHSLQLDGRTLLADEMGCGKTPQAIALMATYDTWPVLIICPASMRLVWAEELERWAPELFQPRSIHVIFSSNDMLPQSRRPGSLGHTRVVIVSVAMARLLHENLSGRGWSVAVVDESHSLRLVQGRPCVSTRAVLDLLREVPHVSSAVFSPPASCYEGPRSLLPRAFLFHRVSMGLALPPQSFVEASSKEIVNASRFPPRPIAGLAAYRLRIPHVLSSDLGKQIGS